MLPDPPPAVISVLGMRGGDFACYEPTTSARETPAKELAIGAKELAMRAYGKQPYFGEK